MSKKRITQAQRELAKSWAERERLPPILKKYPELEKFVFGTDELGLPQGGGEDRANWNYNLLDTFWFLHARCMEWLKLRDGWLEPRAFAAFNYVQNYMCHALLHAGLIKKVTPQGRYILLIENPSRKDIKRFQASWFFFQQDRVAFKKEVKVIEGMHRGEWKLWKKEQEAKGVKSPFPPSSFILPEFEEPKKPKKTAVEQPPPPPPTPPPPPEEPKKVSKPVQTEMEMPDEKTETPAASKETSKPKKFRKKGILEHQSKEEHHSWLHSHMIKGGFEPGCPETAIFHVVSEMVWSTIKSNIRELRKELMDSVQEDIQKFRKELTENVQKDIQKLREELTESINGLVDSIQALQYGLSAQSDLMRSWTVRINERNPSEASESTAYHLTRMTETVCRLLNLANLKTGKKVTALELQQLCSDAYVLGIVEDSGEQEAEAQNQN